MQFEKGMAGQEKHQWNGHGSCAEGGAKEHNVVVLVLRNLGSYALRDHVSILSTAYSSCQFWRAGQCSGAMRN